MDRRPHEDARARARRRGRHVPAAGAARRDGARRADPCQRRRHAPHLRQGLVVARHVRRPPGERTARLRRPRAGVEEVRTRRPEGRRSQGQDRRLRRRSPRRRDGGEVGRDLGRREHARDAPRARHRRPDQPRERPRAAPAHVRHRPDGAPRRQRAVDDRAERDSPDVLRRCGRRAADGRVRQDGEAGARRSRQRGVQAVAPRGEGRHPAQVVEEGRHVAQRDRRDQGVRPRARRRGGRVLGPLRRLRRAPPGHLQRRGRQRDRRGRDAGRGRGVRAARG